VFYSEQIKQCDQLKTMIEVIKLHDDYNNGKIGTNLLFLPKSRHCEERTDDGLINKLLFRDEAISY